ncbi:F27 [Hirschfeldia incana]|nr:F27 [Hirschfeldia incana]
MPQVDLEAFVSSVCAGGSDRKIACESTYVDGPETQTYYNNNSATSPNDFPPESYYITKDAKLEWLTDNAFFDRKESQRGGSSAHINSNPNSNPSSQRFLLSSKASIIGLPKPQDTCLNEAKQRRNGGKKEKNNKVFLKRVGSRMKSDPSQLEPSSPKVSCTGRVRSRRERSRRMRRQKSVRPEKANRVKKPGLLASFRAIFRSRGGCKDGTHTTPVMAQRDNDIRSRLPVEEVEPVVPGLGGMNRFASGRRGDLLGGC